MRPTATIRRLRTPFLVRSALTDRIKAVAQMADDLRVLAANADCVTADDLELVGWTPEQIETHRRAALRAAQAASLRTGEARA